MWRREKGIEREAVVTMRQFSITLVLSFLLVPSFSMSAGPYNYAAEWLQNSPETRAAYVEGMADGIVSGFLDTSGFFEKNGISDETMKKLKWISINRAMQSQIPQVVTHLYGDPENAFINFSLMVSVAKRKLEGADVSGTLCKYREVTIEASRQHK